MASTRSLQNVVSWAQGFVNGRLLAGQGGVPGEPALSIANSVLGFILGPPFAWPWNRNRGTINTTLQTGSSTAYNQSYTVALPDFGWLESATIVDSTGMEYPLEVRLLLEDSTDPGRPDYLSAEGDDGAGNITFKLYCVPDGVYTIKFIYQKKPVLFTSLAGKWAPIPDEKQYIYNSGFLAWAFENIDDGRFGPEYQKFVRYLLSASEGLTDTQKSVFLEEKLSETRQQQNAMMGAQQGRSSRGA